MVCVKLYCLLLSFVLPFKSGSAFLFCCYCWWWLLSILFLKKKRLFPTLGGMTELPSLSLLLCVPALSLALCSRSCRSPAPSAPSSLSELCRPQLPRTSRVSGATAGTFAKETLRCSIRLVLSRAKVRRQMGRHKVELK